MSALSIAKSRNPKSATPKKGSATSNVISRRKVRSAAATAKTPSQADEPRVERVTKQERVLTLLSQQNGASILARKLRHPRRQPHGSRCTTSAPIAGPYWRRHSRSERGPRWPSLESLSAEFIWEPTDDPDDRRAGLVMFLGMRPHLQ